jgi:glutamine synthetase
VEIYDIDFLKKKRRDLLRFALQDFKNNKLIPKIGIELEFYLEPVTDDLDDFTIESFITNLKTSLLKQRINLLEIEKEQGFGQIEVKTKPYDDIYKLCQDVELIKKSIAILSSQQYPNIKPIFLSQPKLNDCGNSLQINISLYDQNQNPQFIKNNKNHDNIALYCIGGILTFAKNMMFIMAPEKEDYIRFNLQTNRQLHKNGKYTAPTHISWGYDNRTALIRVILNNINPRANRLEFRMPSPSADIYLALSFILLSILEGIKNKIAAPPPIHGNSFDQQYKLDLLPQNIKSSQDHFLHESIMKTIISKKLQKCIN